MKEKLQPEDLIEYLTNDTKYKTDPLLKMAVSHYQFEAIHKGKDSGNPIGKNIPHPTCPIQAPIPSLSWKTTHPATPKPD